MVAPGAGSDIFAYGGAGNLEVMLDAVRYNRFLTDQVLRHAGGSRAALDVGSGLGTFAEMVRARGLDVTCLEPDPTLREKLGQKGFATFADLAAVPAGSFDYVFSLNVFEHIADDAAAAREVLRILRPGGSLYLYVPAFPALYGAMDRMVGHHRRYTRDGLSKLFEAAGFHVETTRYVDVLGFFATLLFNAVSPQSGAISSGPVKLYDRLAFPLSRLLDRVTGRLVGKNAYLVARRGSP